VLRPRWGRTLHGHRPRFCETDAMKRYRVSVMRPRWGRTLHEYRPGLYHSDATKRATAMDYSRYGIWTGDHCHARNVGQRRKQMRAHDPSGVIEHRPVTPRRLSTPAGSQNNFCSSCSRPLLTLPHLHHHALAGRCTTSVGLQLQGDQRVRLREAMCCDPDGVEPSVNIDPAYTSPMLRTALPQWTIPDMVYGLAITAMHEM
jgi:hypothetical protein